MDPNATIREITHQAGSRNFTAAMAANNNLFDWISSGGFAPNPSKDEWMGMLILMQHGISHLRSMS